MKVEMTCPTCGSHDISKNGTTRRGKRNYKCRDCNRQFVEDPQWKPKDKNKQSLVDLLLLEKIPLAGIARATGVSESWLQSYVNVCYELVPKAAVVMPKPKGKLKVQMDELWSFVDDKGNKQWVWLAIDADTQEVISCHIGDRSRAFVRSCCNQFLLCTGNVLWSTQTIGSGATPRRFAVLGNAHQDKPTRR